MLAANRDVATDTLATRAEPQSSEPRSVLSALQGKYRAALSREHLPATTTELIVLEDVARRAAHLACCDQALADLESQGAEALCEVELAGSENNEAAPTKHLATVIASPGFQSLVTTSLKGSRALHTAIGRLYDLQQRRHDLNLLFGETDPRFSTEVQCLAYLVRRFRAGEQACRRCGRAAGGSWIAARRCWECRHCQAQSGVRTATVMERSPLPLTRWFAAIRSLLFQPTITTAKLGGMINVNREPTVRQMACKIRAAMKSGDSRRLAGLDHVYLP